MDSIHRPSQHWSLLLSIPFYMTCIFLFSTAAIAQTRKVSPETVICSWDGRLIAGELSEFPPEPAGGVYEQEVDQILNAMVLNRPEHLFVRAYSSSKAAAALEPGSEGEPPRRLILYNQQYFAVLPQTAGRWARYAVLAHELGHHLNFDTDFVRESPQREIHADRFAGSALARLGASLDEAIEVLIDVSEHPTRTHPGRAERRASMVNGWIQEKPEALLGSALQAHLTKVQEAGVERHSGTFTVDETKPFEGRSLIADRIVFPPGASLVLSRTALARSNSFFIVAREIVSDPERPGRITWARPAVPDPPGAPGQASSGRHGQSDGESGAPGQSGAPGATGYVGEDSPSLLLAVQQMDKSARLVIDLEGQSGGLGGAGPRGGDGGNGQRGSHASSTFFDCRRGAGDGGNGGVGGQGGSGGKGGRGGRGGGFTLLAEANSLSRLKEQIEIRVNGGEGGSAGNGGEGGTGGAGGPRGAPSLPWCKDDGKDGARGHQGSAGSGGQPGDRGPNGNFAVGALTEEQIRTLLSGL